MFYCVSFIRNKQIKSRSYSKLKDPAGYNYLQLLDETLETSHHYTGKKK